MATATLDHMSEKKKQADRHKPRRMVGLPERVCAALESLGKEREASLAEMAKVACIFYLESLSKWPPKPAR